MRKRNLLIILASVLCLFSLYLAGSSDKRKEAKERRYAVLKTGRR